MASKATRATGKLIDIKSNPIIGMASKHMEPYRFSEEEALEVGILYLPTQA